MAEEPGTVPRCAWRRKARRPAIGRSSVVGPRRDLLESMVVVHLRSAAILRANGRTSEATRVEQFALRTRLRLDEPRAVRRMHALIETVYESSHAGRLLEHALEGAIELIGADFGNVQLRSPTNGGLRIATHSGFDREFLEYFARVEDDTSACGRAASQRAQMVIFDVNEDSAFAPHRKIAAAARFRAVQSTPVIDPTGRLRGVISTHHRRCHKPSDGDLQLVQWYAEHVGIALARQRNGGSATYEATGGLHAQTADLHDAAAACLNGSARVLLGDGNEARALKSQERARRARERARQERERVRAVAARAQRQRREPSGGDSRQPRS